MSQTERPDNRARYTQYCTWMWWFIVWENKPDSNKTQKADTPNNWAFSTDTSSLDAASDLEHSMILLQGLQGAAAKPIRSPPGRVDGVIALEQYHCSTDGGCDGDIKLHLWIYPTVCTTELSQEESDNRSKLPAAVWKSDCSRSTQSAAVQSFLQLLLWSAWLLSVLWMRVWLQPRLASEE